MQPALQLCVELIKERCIFDILDECLFKLIVTIIFIEINVVRKLFTNNPTYISFFQQKSIDQNLFQ